MSIPKTIHYCWFGQNPLPESARNCIESWKKYCPDYEIKLWNERNFDVFGCQYSAQAYQAKKYAFVTDYARLKIIYEQGGIYLDTDVELRKPFDALLSHDLFLGAEGMYYINTGIGFGAIPHHPLIRQNLEIYQHMCFANEAGEMISKNCPFYTTEVCKEYGFSFLVTGVQLCGKDAVYPNEYFNPYDWKTDTLKLTENTMSIHHYAGTWMTPAQKKAIIINAKNEKIGEKYGKMAKKAADFIVWNKTENGGPGVLRALYKKVRHK